MAQMPIIHVVDDDVSFQKAVARLLRNSGYEVRCHANAGSFLLDSPDERRGCILLDVRMPGPNGLELQEALAKRSQPWPIIFLTGHPDVLTSVRAMKAGAVDFLTKPVKREDLLSAIESALARDAGKHILHEQLRKSQADYDTLTAREREVFERVVAGKMNKEIASELGAAERTVKAHRAQVMQKMHATSLAELVHIADKLEASGAIQVPALN